jgi:adenylyltransferase/sulfurtransferase
VFPEAARIRSAPTPEQVGVLGPVPGIIGCVQAAEAVKLLTGVGTTLVGRLLVVDALGLGFETIAIERQGGCKVCGDVGRSAGEGT